MNHKQSNIKINILHLHPNNVRKKNLFSFILDGPSTGLQKLKESLINGPRWRSFFSKKVSGMLLSMVFLENITSNELVSDPNNNKINS